MTVSLAAVCVCVCVCVCVRALASVHTKQLLFQSDSATKRLPA